MEVAELVILREVGGLNSADTTVRYLSTYVPLCITPKLIFLHDLETS